SRYRHDQYTFSRPPRHKFKIQFHPVTQQALQKPARNALNSNEYPKSMATLPKDFMPELRRSSHPARMLPRVLLTAMILPGLILAGTPDPGQEVTRATLDNGLRVVVVRSSLAPVVTTVVNYLVGSNEAPQGFPGTAHALEHMMFRGSHDLSGGHLTKIAA